MSTINYRNTYIVPRSNVPFWCFRVSISDIRQLHRRSHHYGQTVITRQLVKVRHNSKLTAISRTHPNVGNFQSAVQITRSRRKRHSVCACPSDLGPKETLVTTLEDDFTACKSKKKNVIMMLQQMGIVSPMMNHKYLWVMCCAEINILKIINFRSK